MRLLVSGGGGGGGRRVEGSLGERVSAGLGGHSTRDDRGWEDDVTTIAVVIVVIVIVVIVVAAGVCDESRVEVVTGRGESGRRREGVGLWSCSHHSSRCPSIPLVVVNQPLFLLLLVAQRDEGGEREGRWGGGGAIGPRPRPLPPPL